MAQGSLRQASVASDVAKLPRLRPPNLNRKAQEIIAAHMRSGCSTSSVFSTATVHVLSKIESTATRHARSHDISHLQDGAPCLAPKIPPSLIAKEDHVYEKRFLPEESGSTYNEQDGMWYAKVFPSDKPSSRTDAVMLDAWITRSLERYVDVSTGEERQDLAKNVEALVPILSVGLHEIARQVTHHCAERGLALEKIWRCYVELFDRVLRQMRASLQEQRRKTADTQKVLQDVRAQLREVRRRHPEDLQNAIKDLEKKFTQCQRESEQDLKKANEESAQLQQELKGQRRELDMWFPGFSFYQDSYIKSALPQRNIPRPHAHNNNNLLAHNSSEAALSEGGAPVSRQESKSGPCGGEDGEVTSEVAEVAFAEDLKRLLAVLAPDKRRMIGQELAFIMETSEGASPDGRSGRKHGVPRRRSSTFAQAGAGDKDREKAKLEAESLEKLRADIRKQEERILELREEISRVETGQADEVEELLAEAWMKQRRKDDAESDLSALQAVASMEEEFGRMVVGGKGIQAMAEHAGERGGSPDSQR